MPICQKINGDLYDTSINHRHDKMFVTYYLVTRILSLFKNLCTNQIFYYLSVRVPGLRSSARYLKCILGFVSSDCMPHVTSANGICGRPVATPLDDKTYT